ncbi:16S rRNA (cytosine(1407)-C(5))-methyltransferase RsmF [Pleionea sediminis]|uniref:16S rRNA (cytosine(1407)-C(5))-methyltransferase RsmF n=1 Tax=Pleionea sediminis TaxID=2569479 RepID=UPI001185489A|nr:16S rRNA (cytosine(1407)-C(5))-methyltransferase RsmF [Pleionea sediminis]
MTQIPDNFINHLLSQSLDKSEVEAFIHSCKTPLRKSIRVNTQKISVDKFSQWASSIGWQLKSIPWCPEGFWVDLPKELEDVSLGNYVEHLQGLYYIQEASSMLPPTAMRLALSNANFVLDMAAAPGSKTTQIANYIAPECTLVANELASSRLKVLHANILRCGVGNACLTHYDAAVFGEKLPEKFDAILLDTPCGGEGTIRKDPDALQNWSLDALKTLASVQQKLIVSAFNALAEGGVLVYSTCTLSKEENQFICNYLLQEFPELVSIVSLETLFPGAQSCVTPEGYLHVFPHIYDSEGFFVAAFQKKRANQSSATSEKLPKNWPYSKLTKKVYQQIESYFQNHFGFSLQGLKDGLWIRENVIWYFPEGATKIISALKVERAGFKVAELHKNTIKSLHDFAIVYGHEFSKQLVELNSCQAKDYSQGKDISVQQLPDKGECLLTYRSIPLGFGKVVNNRIKNRLPRPLVRDNAYTLTS